MMKLAVNYSPLLATLVQAGKVEIDVFKCPVWESVVSVAQPLRPAYVHFPLLVGSGKGTAWNSERNAPADWDEIDGWLSRTDTPYVNLHLDVTKTMYPDIPMDSDNPAHFARLVDRALTDINEVIRRYGKEKVIVENLYSDRETSLRFMCHPDFIRTVIDTADCGMLLDVSHARLAADHLGIAYDDYFAALPTARVRELHLTGIQPAEVWLPKMRDAGIPDNWIAKYVGQDVDHLPMIEADWAFWAWSLAQVRAGQWGKPWCVGYEVGGVSHLWEFIANNADLEQQIPRLYRSLYQNMESGKQNAEHDHPRI